MIPPPPTSTLFPYTTLFRSYQFRCLALGQLRLGALVHALERLDVRVDVVELEVRGRPELIPVSAGETDGEDAQHHEVSVAWIHGSHGITSPRPRGARGARRWHWD